MSYNNIRMQNQAWSRMVFAQISSIPSFRRGVVTHSTIDNNDGRQDTCQHMGAYDPHSQHVENNVEKAAPDQIFLQALRNDEQWQAQYST